MISRYERERKKRGDKEDELQEVVVSKLQPLSLRSHTAKRVTPTTLLFPPPTVAADFGDPFVRSRIVVERSLPNGDVFSGEFSGSVPHGVGKYLWSDGCMYEGDWVDGKTTGNGKFSWPSGATYEGEFNGGFMDGFGTMVGVDGDTYRGTWAANQKHGFGRKTYGNGDTYEGYWKRDLREGEGKYVWKNDNVYEGEWRSGVIWGRGIFILAGGNRYEGWWENGVPTGELVSGFPDGYSFRVGNFGVNVAGDCLTRKRSSVCGRCRPILDQICLWESDGEDGDVTCDIVNRNSLFSKGVSNGGHHHLFVGELSLARFTGEVKKQGQPICKGHKNYELMLSLQLGIRYSVGKSSASLMQELKSTDLDPKQRVRIRFPREGSKLTPPHQSVEFKWKDYCPAAFGHLRSLFKIDPADYMFSMCGNDAFRELSSPGKSGSFFYLTHDDRFMIKTVKKSEVKVLLRMLSSYYDHFHQYENSLVTKFYGVYCVKPIGGQKMRFIVMGNLFCSELRIHRRFDLKGSSYGRSTNKLEIDETTTLKDLDLNFVFRLERYWFHQLHKQIDRDCQFLEGERIMDYSLLVGLHFCDTSTLSLSLSKDSFLSEDKTPPISDCINSPRLGANMPARVEQVYGQSNGGGSPSCDLCDVILYFGIIDILQGYDIGKKLENAYKSFRIDPVSISAVDPKLYSKRLRDFISRIFLED